jgi:hypothetical protein
MTMPKKNATKTIAERRAEAALEVKQMRARHKEHALECREVLADLLAETVCPQCACPDWRTMSELTSVLAEEPVWCWTADGTKADWQDRYELLREVVYQMRKAEVIDSHVVVQDDGVHRRIVRLHTEKECGCPDNKVGPVVVPIEEARKLRERILRERKLKHGGDAA